MNITQTIEALLFVGGQDFSVKKIAKLIDTSEENVEKSIEEIIKKYSGDSGILLMRINDKIRLATHPDVAQDISEIINTEVTGELTRPQLETLTIICYRSPIIKPEIELIRGVNCALILRNLLIRGLIEEIQGHTEVAYQPTFDFLRFLGVSSVKDLPNYNELSISDLIGRLEEAQEQRKNSE